jgi:ribonuclease E
MSKQIVIAEQHRIAAVFSEDQIQELIVATGTHQVSDIYMGVVENVLPGIDAAFVNIGDSDRNGFIHVSDLGPLKLRKTMGSITELLAPQQKVLVQVMKEPTGTKGPRLTGNISLPGRYLVLMPYGRGVNLSRRIRSENERNRLRALAILTKPAGMGILVRTEAEDMPEEAILEDLELLQKQWESVIQEASSTTRPSLLNRDDDFIQRVLRDVYSADVNRIVVDSAPGLTRVKRHLTSWGGGKLPQNILVDHHKERSPMLEYFRVNAAIREAMKPRVDLPSGGYIIIEKTEALTVIDVNSGSFTRSATARETVLWTNCEAATEIARQLRLRNIAGVIVVDFIDMESRRDQLQVLEHFNKAMRSDKAKPQIAQLTELGLVELTRKRQGKNIYELFGQACATCGGLGQVVNLPGEQPAQQIHSPHEHREYRRSAEPRRESFEPVALNEEYEEGGEGNDLDLNHHPSYQERNGRRGRGGRRRRGELAFPTARTTTPWEEEERSSSPSSSRPSREPREPRESRDPRETREPREARESREPRESRDPRGRPERALPSSRILPAVTVAADMFADEPGEELAGPPPRAEREDRSRGRGRRDRGPIEPPEVIHVEMSEQEQEVFAWMGVSPLWMSEQQVKNPRNTLIAVTLPGEEPPAMFLEAMAAHAAGSVAVIEQPELDLEYDEPEEQEEAPYEPAPYVPYVPAPYVPASYAPVSTTEPVSAKPLLRRKSSIMPAVTEPVPEILQSSPDPIPVLADSNEEDSAEGIVRRRRRRSSAAG